jgi:nucleotide-binding universal stress UspA family protein
MYKHILLPTDGSPAAAAALQSALQFAREAGAQVTALHVQPDFHLFSFQAEMLEDSREAFLRDTAAHGAKVLAELAAAAQALGVPCQTMTTRSDQPHQKIVEAAQAQGCDLIAMATHGLTGLKGLLLGSETHKVLLHSTVPVLVFQAKP